VSRLIARSVREATGQRKRKRASNQCRSPSPDQGAVWNSMADAPFGARSRGCFHTSRARGLRLVVLGEAVGRLRVVQNVSVAVTGPQWSIYSWKLEGSPTQESQPREPEPTVSLGRRPRGCQPPGPGITWRALHPHKYCRNPSFLGAATGQSGANFTGGPGTADPLSKAVKA
jgi:hypothetical protein